MPEWLRKPWFREFEPVRVVPKGATEPVEAVPVLFSGFPSLEEAGFGLRFKRFGEVRHRTDAFRVGRTLYLCALVGPHDLFAFWRGCLLLARCREVDDWLVQNCLFDATARGREERRQPADRARVIEALDGGEATLEAAMAERPPEWLLEKIVELWSLRGSNPSPRILTEERRAGTIEWRPAFDRLGALTPEESDRRDALWERLRPAYLPVMRRIGKAAGAPVATPIDERYALSEFRGALIALHDAGAEEKHGPHVVAAVAFVASKRSSPRVLAEVAATFAGELHPLAIARDADRREERLIRLLAPWVAKRMRAGAPFHVDQVGDARIFLAFQLRRHFPRPSHERLLREEILARYDVRLAP